MKFIKSVILIVLMLVFCFQQWVVIIAFDFNQQYISQNLCVKRNKPHNCCKGKCYLGKVLQKNTDNSTEAKAPIKYKVEVFTDRHDYIPLDRYYSMMDSVFFSKAQEFTLQPYRKTTFHPPDLFA